MKKRILLISVGVLLLGALGILANLFLIGEPVDGEQLICTVSPEGPNLCVKVETAESGMALRGWKQRQEGGSLSITARKVPVSAFFPEGSNTFVLGTESVDRVLVGGKVVWERE